MCRSFLSFWENPLTGEEQYLGRANLGVVSVILPTIAKFSKVEGKDFWKTLDYFCELSYTAHMERINRSAKIKAIHNPMFMYGALARLDPDEEIGKLFTNGRFTASLGFIGVAETCEILYGKLDKEKSLEILRFLNEKCKEWEERSNIHFSAYGTPAETLCYKAVVSYNKLFPDEPWNRDYFTNSFHQPVWIESDPFEKWGYEEGFAELSSGGNIGYIETSNLKDNVPALESLIEYAYNTIPYFGFNQPIDQCFDCGYEGEFDVDDEGYICPNCGNREPNKMSVIRRVCGYLSSPEERPFIKGKSEEVKERVKHN